jgi:hypothetical protein
MAVFWVCTALDRLCFSFISAAFSQGLTLLFPFQLNLSVIQVSI